MRVCARCRSIYATSVEFCGIDGRRLRQQASDPHVGRELGDYHVLECIGEGASGRIYRARNDALNGDCAIKVIFGEYAAQADLVERFRREAHAIAQMWHPHIVSILEFGTTNEGLSFLVMEYVDGPDLSEIIAREAPFSPERAGHITRQIATGLGEAHKNGFIHRDVKPGNIKLSRTEGREHVSILDFGIVGVVEAASWPRLTQTGLAIGTPTYMAPEQGTASAIGPQSDFYSLGVILYEMLAGRPPFEGATFREVLLKHITQTPPPTPPADGLEELVSWLMSKNPADRPRDAQEIVEAIDLRLPDVTRVDSVERARPSSSTDRPPIPMGRHDTDPELDLGDETIAVGDETIADPRPGAHRIRRSKTPATLPPHATTERGERGTNPSSVVERRTVGRPPSSPVLADDLLHDTSPDPTERAKHPAARRKA